MKKKSVDMLCGSVMGGFLSLTIPIMIMNVAQILFNVIDMRILKVFGYENATGAVGATGTLMALSTSLVIGIAAGANVVVARHIGAKERERAESAIITSLLFSVFAGIVLMIVGVIFARDFLMMTNCAQSLLDDATKYFQIYFYGIPIQLAYNFCSSILRALGDTKRPMYFLLLGGACKVVFTVLLLLMFEAAVESVAIATIISNLVAFVLSFITLLGKKDMVTLSRKKICFDMTELKAMLYNGIPSGFQSALYSFANVIIVSTVNGFGAAATTGIAIANQFDGILYQIALAPHYAVIPYVAQNMGAGNFKRTKKAIYSAMLITVAFGATLGSLSAIFSHELSYLLHSSAEIVEFSSQKMIIVSSTYFICGINEVVGGALKGLGKPISSAVTSLIFLCALRFLWVYFIFPLCPNLTFLYAVWPVGWTLSIITLLPLLCFAYKKAAKNFDLKQNVFEKAS